MVTTLSLINQSSNDITNISTLSKKSSCERFYVKDGVIIKMGFIDSFFHMISKYFFKNYYLKVQNNLKATISDLTSRIKDGDKDFLKTLFFDKMVSISQDCYDRSKINKSVLNILKKEVEQSFDLLILKKRQNFISKILFLNKSIDKEIFKKSLSDVSLALALGVRPIKPQGYSDTYILSDLNHKNIGVFKPATKDSLSKEAPFFLTRWQNKFLNFIGFGGAIYKHVAGKCHIAEKVSYLIDRQINANIIPITSVVSLNPMKYKYPKNNPIKGSLQLFYDNAISAKEFFNINKNYTKKLGVFPGKKDLKRINPQDFDKLVINDIICGNIDRHSENWLVHKISSKIALIDNGMSFSPSQSNNNWEKVKQYTWAKKTFPLSNREFSDEAKEIIKKVHKMKDYLKEIVIITYVTEGDKEKIAIKRAGATAQRIDMLYKFAIIKNYPIYKLSEFKSENEIKQLL